MSVIGAAAFRSQLDRWDVDYVEHSRYDRCAGKTVPWYEHEARRSSDCARRGWDAHGIAVHHTGGPTSWQFVWDGRRADGIPGPLYIAEIYDDGVAHLTGWGVSNNVGKCDRTIRDRVLAGRMPTSGGNVSPGPDDYSAANSEFYGIAYRGTRPNAAQRKTALRICAAICEAHGPDWDGGSIAGHKELTRRKPDPEGEDMSRFRRELNALLKVGPGGTAPKPPPQEDDMTPQEMRQLLTNFFDQPVGEYHDGEPMSRDEALHRAAKFSGINTNHLVYRVIPALADQDELADKIAERLGGSADVAQVRQAIRDVFGSLDDE